MEFGERYLRYPLYLVDGFVAYSGDNYAKDLLRAQNKHENLEKALAEGSLRISIGKYNTLDEAWILVDKIRALTEELRNLMTV